MELVSKHCVVEVYTGEGYPSHNELLSRITDKDGLLCFVANKIGKEIMDAGPKLKVISTASAGYNHLEVSEATQRGIYVCNTPGGPTEATADLAFTLLLATARRVVEADRFVRNGEWKILTPLIFFGAPVWKKTIGIIGFGQVGRAVARRANGFNMEVLYTDVAPAASQIENELSAKFIPLDDLLRESDFISLHTPVTKETYHLINEERLKLMKPTAILINTSRGPTVDEAALFQTLKEKRIAGAGLDVFEKEPISEDNPLIGLDNVVLLPHIGSSTEETRINMELMAVENLLTVFKGERPSGWLNPEAQVVRGPADMKAV